MTHTSNIDLISLSDRMKGFVDKWVLKKKASRDIEILSHMGLVLGLRIQAKANDPYKFEIVHLDPQPLELILHCPECRGRHIDEGEFADKVHHTHSCQHCGFTWRPAVEPTKGVQFLEGFKNGQ